MIYVSHQHWMFMRHSADELKCLDVRSKSWNIQLSVETKLRHIKRHCAEKGTTDENFWYIWHKVVPKDTIISNT